MKNSYVFITLVLFAGVIVTGTGCHSNADRDNPKDLLDRYFLSAIKQDYGAAYGCYYAAYQARVSKDEYVRHRKEASVLQSYRVTSITENGDAAEAQVKLTFGPSQKLNRARPVTTEVREDMVRENGVWKIKVW